MNKNILFFNESKLVNYSKLAGTFILTGSSLQAQVDYTDVDPDEHIVNGTYDLNLNNDASVDFQISQSGGGNYAEITMEVKDSNAVMGMCYGNYGRPYKLNMNMLINVNQNWSICTKGNMLIEYKGTEVDDGKWYDASEKFLGLKLVTGGNTYYGWARLSIDSQAGGFTIHDYAYETTPDREVLAGWKDTYVFSEQIEEQADGIHIYEFDKTLHIISETGNTGKLIIYNNMGQECYHSFLNGKYSMVSLYSLPEGMYIVKYQANERIYTKKIPVN